MFVITQNKRVIVRGFQTYQAAWNWVNEHVKGLDSHKHHSKIYTADYNVLEDRAVVTLQNDLWQSCKTHTQVRM